MVRTWSFVSLVVVLLAATGVWFLFVHDRHLDQAATPSPLVTVRFGMIPYGDHTYAIIGIKKGWFRDVGIDIRYDTIKDEQVVPFLENNSYDVVSTSPGILLAGYNNAPDLGMFVFGTIFQGYAIMAQPNMGYKTYAEFTAEGLTPVNAIKATIDQMKGKVFAYPSEGGIQPFVQLVLKSGGLSTGDFRALIVDDPVAVNAMRTKRADFQVGGAPSRVTLESEGFVPIISAIDFVNSGSAASNPQELSAVFPDGWGTTKEYYTKNHDTILRLASVEFRIIDFIVEHPNDALAIQLPYLDQVTGQKFSLAEGLVIYKDLDPFVTFEQQKGWFEDPNNPLNVDKVITAAISSFESQREFQNGVPQVKDVMYADQVFSELEQLRAESVALQTQIEGQGTQSLSDQQQKEYNDGKTFFNEFDYLDSANEFRSVLASVGS